MKKGSNSMTTTCQMVHLIAHGVFKQPTFRSSEPVNLYTLQAITKKSANCPPCRTLIAEGKPHKHGHKQQTFARIMKPSHKHLGCTSEPVDLYTLHSSHSPGHQTNYTPHKHCPRCLNTTQIPTISAARRESISIARLCTFCRRRMEQTSSPKMCSRGEGEKAKEVVLGRLRWKR